MQLVVDPHQERYYRHGEHVRRHPLR
jgi:hypothetical protein